MKIITALFLGFAFGSLSMHLYQSYDRSNETIKLADTPVAKINHRISQSYANEACVTEFIRDYEPASGRKLRPGIIPRVLHSKAFSTDQDRIYCLLDIETATFLLNNGFQRSHERVFFYLDKGFVIRKTSQKDYDKTYNSLTKRKANL